MDHLETPPWLVDEIYRFRRIHVDAFGRAGTAATERAVAYWTRGALERRWDGLGCLFIQPPYSRGWLPAVAPKMEAEGDAVLALVPATTEAAWWHDHVAPAATAICFVRRRVTFLLDGEPLRDAKGRVTPAWFASAIVYYAESDHPSYGQRFCSHFDSLGWCVRLDGASRRLRQLRLA